VDEEAREEFQWLHEIGGESRGRQDFRVEVMGPRNRLGKLTRTESVRLMLGQRMPAINFREVLDEGHIILVNLSGGPRASDMSCELLGRLLTRFLFFNAQRRQHPERPFFFYLDECQLYLSGDVSRMLAEARKYGVGVVLAHQYLWQLEKAGEDILHAVRNATNLKAFFRIKDAREAADHAETAIPLDLEMPVQASVRPTSVGIELVKLGSESRTEQESSTESHAEAEAESYAKTLSYLDSYATSHAHGTSSTESESFSSADGASQMNLSGAGTGMSNRDDDARLTTVRQPHLDRYEREREFNGPQLARTWYQLYERPRHKQSDRQRLYVCRDDRTGAERS
jgi:Type IV secretion-system coupling protein DNA-binding domain